MSKYDKTVPMTDADIDEFEENLAEGNYVDDDLWFSIIDIAKEGRAALREIKQQAGDDYLRKWALDIANKGLKE